MAHTSSSIEEGPELNGGLESLAGSDSNNRNARFVLVGLNHRSAPMEIRQQVSFSKELLPHALVQLKNEVSDGVIVSTCSRTEVYTMSHTPERSFRKITEFLHRFHGLDQGSVDAYLYTQTDNDVATHLFNVASGLDSVVMGEWQILDQVRHSMKAAANHDQVELPSSLYRLFHGAIETGREARIETGFGENGTDLGQAVARCSYSALHDISNANVLIIGAGDIAKLTAEALFQVGVARIIVANRSAERGQSLADQVGETAIGLAHIPEALQTADIVVSATGAPGFTITRDMVVEARKHNPNKAIFIADLAVPPDVDPDVATLENIWSLDIEQIQKTAADVSNNSGNEAAAATVITKGGLDRFNNWLDSLDVAPQIRKLQQQAERIRQQEMEKSLKKLTHITDDQLAAVDALTRSIVKKLLHEPIKALKESAGKYEPRSHTLASSRELLLSRNPEYANLEPGEVPPTAGETVSITA